LILSRNVKAADLFLPQEVALFVAVDEVDHRGWRVAHPVKDVSIHTDVPAQRSVILSYWDDTSDRAVDGGVDAEGRGTHQRRGCRVAFGGGKLPSGD
jgi:hypothetical protein